MALSAETGTPGLSHFEGCHVIVKQVSRKVLHEVTVAKVCSVSCRQPQISVCQWLCQPLHFDKMLGERLSLSEMTAL